MLPNPQLAEILGKPADFDFGGGDFVNTNALHARSDEAIRVYPISATTLRSAHDDLQVVLKYLMACEERILDARYPQQRTPRPQAAAELSALRATQWAWTVPPQADGHLQM